MSQVSPSSPSSSRSPAPRGDLAAYAFLTIAIFFWGTNSIVGRYAGAHDMPPIALTFWRWLVAFLIMLPFTWRRIATLRGLLLRHWKYLTAFGFMGVTLFNSFLYIGLQHTSAVQGALILSGMPVLVLILCVVILGMRIGPVQWIGVALSISGVALVVLQGRIADIAQFRPNIGDLWLCGGLILWGIQTFSLRYKPAGIPMTVFVTVTMGIGTLLLIPWYLWEIEMGRVLPVTPISIAAIVYIAIFPSAVAFTLYNEGVVRIGGETAGYFGNLLPVFTAILAVLLLGETFAWYHAAGGALVLAGIYLATMARRRAMARARNAG